MQESVNTFPAAALAGDTFGPINDIDSGVNAGTSAIKFGRVVASADPADPKKFKAVDNVNEPVLAVAVRDSKQESGDYPVAASVGALVFGKVYLESEDNIAAGADVYVVAMGKPQQQTLTFSGNLITGNQVDMTVDGTAISVPFNTDHDTTMADLQTAIAAVGSVASVTGAGAGSLVLTVTAGVNGTDVVIANALVTGGASQATIAVAETVAGISDADASGKIRSDADNGRAFMGPHITLLEPATALAPVPAFVQFL